MRNKPEIIYPSVDALVDANREVLDKYGWWNEYVEAMVRYGTHKEDEGKYTKGLSIYFLIRCTLISGKDIPLRYCTVRVRASATQDKIASSWWSISVSIAALRAGFSPDQYQEYGPPTSGAA
jgi:hypothetical protein